MATSERMQVFQSYSCQLCNDVDTMEMVQCDTCNLWSHYECVGVTDDIAERVWSCEQCVQLQEEVRDLEKHLGSPKQPGAFTYATSKSSTRKSITARQRSVALEKLEEELAIKLDFLERRYRILELTESENEEVSRANDKASMEYTLRWAKEVQDVSQRLNEMTFRDDVSISLSDKEREFINKRSVHDLRNNLTTKAAGSTRRSSGNILRHSVLESEADIQQKQTSHSKPAYTIEPRFESKGVPRIPRRIIQEVRQVNNPRRVFETQDREVKFVNGPTEEERERYRWPLGDNVGLTSTDHRPKTSEVYDWNNLNSHGHSRQPFDNFQSPSVTQPLMQSYDVGRSTPFAQPMSGIQLGALTHGNQGSGYVGRHPTTTLTPTHIASRHVFKDLPEFHGRAEDWPIFISALKNSTEACGYSDGENLGRLQKSLKGDAKDLVRSRLVHASSVPGVVETLHLIFGRSSVIIQQLLDKIAATPSPKDGDLGALIKFAIAVQNLSSTIVSSGDLEYLQNPMLIQKITDKLPTQTALNWAYFKFGSGPANLSTLGNWLYQLAQAATDVVNPSSLKFNDKREQNKDDNGKRPKGWQTNHSNGQSVKPVDTNNSSSSKKPFKCNACGSDSFHKLENCKRFKEMSCDDRWVLIKKFNVCGSCFGNHHYFKCQNKTKCNKDGCTANHHIMLHNTQKKVATATTEAREVASANSHRSIWTPSKHPDVFRIVPVILSYHGHSIRIFVYLDDGSNLTSLEESIADKLGATGTKSPLCVLWALGINQVESNSRQLSIRISGVFNGAEEFIMDHVRTVKRLVLPTQSISKRWLKQYSHFDGIPISTYSQAVPQMIIGLEYSKLMVSLETVEGEWTQPIVCRTRLGWVVQGPNDQYLPNSYASKHGVNMCECQMVDNVLHQMVKEFFSLENFGVKVSNVAMESTDIIRARKLLDSTIVKRGDRFESALLWRKEDIQLPNNLSMALKRLECVESKMKRNPDLAKRMCSYIADFV